ncbi:LANO_0A00760g1_1 [Lachancea nothofagi CBS 11611]|uniref:LANO_0A00760g1_1 n=1 Tax=Lachancea nothofagi CBS 11611 TaxID=1266666 RepID=A0A1G4IM01_9SACH|nr:LANO_0A00760g1_1 [Lachancea nothofagi CBS 11611]
MSFSHELGNTLFYLLMASFALSVVHAVQTGNGFEPVAADTIYTDMQLEPFLKENYDALNGTDKVVVNTTTGLVLAGFVIKSPHGQEGILAKDTDILAWWNQYQVAKRGHWWSPWSPASCCVWNGIGKPTSYSMSYTSFSSWSFKAGFSASWNLVQRALEMSIHYPVTESYNRTGTQTCELNGVGPVQVWYRQHMVWADMQKQFCIVGTSPSLHCGSWSAYYRVDTPISGIYEVKCNVGEDKTKCEAPGLPCFYRT